MLTLPFAAISTRDAGAACCLLADGASPFASTCGTLSTNIANTLGRADYRFVRQRRVSCFHRRLLQPPRKVSDRFEREGTTDHQLAARTTDGLAGHGKPRERRSWLSECFSRGHAGLN